MNTRKNVAGVSLSALCWPALVAAEVDPFEPPTLVMDVAASNAGGGHGAAVALSDSVAVVGRPFDDSAGSVGGAVDVYRRLATEATLDGVPWEWVHWCRLEPATPMAGSRFGNAVSVDGTTVVVGAWSDDRAGDNAGAAWVFELPESPQMVLTSEALLAPIGLLEADYFGWDVAVSGDTIAVGAWGVDVLAEDDHAGAVWLFERQDGEFVEVAQLTAGTDAAGGDRFGAAIDLEDDVLLVGAPDRGSNSGAVYSFLHANGQWAQVQRIDSPEGDAGEHFGAAVVVVFNTAGSGTGGAGIGAPGDNELGPLAGAGWGFPHLGNGIFDIATAVKVTVEGGGAWDQAGSSIDGLDVDYGDDDGGGGILLGVPGWRNPDDGIVEGAVYYTELSEGEVDGSEFGRLDLFTDEGAGMGTSIAVIHSVVDPWGFEAVTVVAGAPGRSGGLGAATLVDIPTGDDGGDCNEDGRFDPMEVLFEPEVHDCDADGDHDSCQIFHNPWMDCDQDSKLDMCQIDDDPALDCDDNGQLDACEIVSDPAGLDCDGDGLLDSCLIDATPEADCDGDGVLDSCLIDATPEADCDGDGVLDVCVIADDPFADCDGNGVLDVCEQPSLPGGGDWMTEQFINEVDLQGLGLRLTPTGNQTPPLWQLCTTLSGDVWLDPSGHTPLLLDDDEAVLYSLPFPFTFAGQTWSDVFVGSNGYVTFGTADMTYTETLAAHFDRLRLSVLFDDLDPSVAGEVLVGQGPAGSFVVTWSGIPEYNSPGTSNTVQLVLHPDGAIEMSWPSLTATTAIVGPSIGGGVPPNFIATDLSDAWDCVAHAAGDGDCNENSLPDACEAGPVGDPLWGVEHFASDFDLGGSMVRWQPTGSATPPFWQVCSDSVTAFPIDPAGHTQVVLADDDALPWPIGFPFPFFGETYDTVNISSNGFVDFGQGAYDHETSLYIFFQEPRIAGFMADLDPSAGGQVLAGTGPAGSLVITWQDVPIYFQTGSDVDMQILLHPDGAFEIAWLGGIDSFGVVGVSEGGGIPIGFAQTDLSASGAECVLTQPFDDCNANGILDGIEIALGCELDYDLDGIPESCQGGGFGGIASICASDVTRDGEINVHDLLRVLRAWGDVKVASIDARCDLSPEKGDLRVDLADLIEVLVGMQTGCGGQP